MRLFTSESVTEGHPDKVADAVSDAVLDALLTQDGGSRVAIETLLTTGTCIVSGEVTTQGYADVATIARRTICAVGYDRPEASFDGNSCGVMVAIGHQSPDIAQGVRESWETRHGAAHDTFDAQGAGDQGLIFGFACRETDNLMPLPVDMAHRMSERLSEVRKSGELDYLLPDGKTQVTVAYDDAGMPAGVAAVVVSSQHADGVSLSEQLEPDLRRTVISPVLERYGFDGDSPDIFINPTGKFVVGGPMADVGVTGRKIIVDSYGGTARHGGGAFSGKDPSKVDRSAAYALRWVAKNIVAAELADRVEVQVAYAIGKAHPVGVYVDTFGTGRVEDDRIQKAVLQVFDLRPAAVVERLDLLRPIYSKTVNYGHFGRPDPDFTWEATDRVAELTAALG